MAQPVILDLDPDFDCGDIPPFAMILRLEQLGECDIRAVTSCSMNATSPACVDIWMRYAGRSAVPIGSYQGSANTETGDTWATAVLRAFGDTYGVSQTSTRASYPSAVSVLRQALVNLPAGPKAKIITQGSFVNVSDLLDSPADGISSLNGVDLVTAKVDSFHCMGGTFPSGGVEANANSHGVTFTQNFANISPVPIYWHAFNIGNTIMAGFPTYLDNARDPFKRAWDICAPQQTAGERAMWDATPTLAALRNGANELYTFIGPGTVDFTSGTAFTANPAGKNFYSTKVASDATFRSIINGLVEACVQQLDVFGPTFTSVQGVNVQGGTTLAHFLITTEVATFSIVSGADRSNFEISGSTLRWTGNGTRAFANPVDVNKDNVYFVVVRATDTKGNTTDQTISVAVQAGAVTPVSIVATDHAVDAVDRTVYTFTARSLGTAAADRRIVVAVSKRFGLERITSVSIAGVVVTTSIVDVFIDGINLAALYVADVPTGTTGDIIVTFSTGTTRCGIGVWAIYGAASKTPNNVAFSPSSPAVRSITVPALGAAVGYVLTGGTSVTTAWTNLTETFDEAVEGGIVHSGASANIPAGGSTSLTATFSGSVTLGQGTIFAAWGPGGALSNADPGQSVGSGNTLLCQSIIA